MILGVIPARYASSRFPGKPLIDIAGKSMIQRVYEQASACKQLDEVIVATDDTRIFSHVEGFGGKVEMTADSHPSGTDRVAEVAGRHLAFPWVINIQGDEPVLAPGQLDELITGLQTPGATIATLKRKITDPVDITRSQVVKVVTNEAGMALYFSRSPIPFQRDPDGETDLYFRHIGLYGFHRDTLLTLPKLMPHPLELAESLEQLRWLANGHPIRVVETHYDSHAIDTPDDLQRLLAENFPHHM